VIYFFKMRILDVNSISINTSNGVVSSATTYYESTHGRIWNFHVLLQPQKSCLLPQECYCWYFFCYCWYFSFCQGLTKLCIPLEVYLLCVIHSIWNFHLFQLTQH